MVIKNREQREASERFEIYLRGWRDAATKYMEDSRIMDHPRDDLVSAYRAGYEDGTRARESAYRAAMNRYGYKPSILRGGGK